MNLATLRLAAIITSVTATLGWAGVFTILGMDLLQAYEASGMLAGYVVSLVLGFGSTVATFPLWATWILRRSRDYETI